MVTMESKRQSEITAKIKEDGSIRFFRNDAKKSGVSELACCTESGVANTLTTNGIKCFLKEKKKSEIKVEQIGNFTESKRSNPNTNRVYDKGGLSPTLNTMKGGGRQPMIIDDKKARYRIRKLTPKECWRLMDFSDCDFEKAQAVNSNTQLYKQAGNSIVKSCLMAIFRKLDL